MEPVELPSPHPVTDGGGRCRNCEVRGAGRTPATVWGLWKDNNYSDDPPQWFQYCDGCVKEMTPPESEGLGCEIVAVLPINQHPKEEGGIFYPMGEYEKTHEPPYPHAKRNDGLCWNGAAHGVKVEPATHWGLWECDYGPDKGKRVWFAYCEKCATHSGLSLVEVRPLDAPDPYAPTPLEFEEDPALFADFDPRAGF